MEGNRNALTLGFHKRPVIRRPDSSAKSKTPTRNGIRSPSKSSTQPLKTGSPPLGSRPQTMTRSTNSFQLYSQRREEVSYLDDPDCISLRESLLKDPDFTKIEDDKLQKLNSHLREYLTDLSIHEKYDEAKQISLLSDYTKLEIQTRKRNASITSRSIASNRETKERIRQDFDEQIRVLNERLDEKIEKIKEQQKDEIEKFENTWSTEMPRKYRKPSQKLLELKEIERNLALSNDFEGAKRIHAEAVTMAEQETKAAQKLLVKDYRQARAQMEEKHKRDINTVETIRERKTNVLNQQRDKRIKELDNRDIVLQMKEKEYETGFRERSNPNNIQPTYGSCRRRVQQPVDTLLGDLLPPNDKKFEEEEKRINAERRRKQQEFQRKNAEELYGEDVGNASRQSRSRRSSNASTSYSSTRNRQNIQATSTNQQNENETPKDLIDNGLENKFTNITSPNPDTYPENPQN